MKTDIAIMTIREDEFEAVRERFKTTRQRMPGGRPYLIGEIATYNGHRYTIAIARSIEQGNDASQRLAHDIIQNLDPQLILLVGIAGGLPSKELTLGDVVVSSHIVNPNIDARNADGTTDYMVGGGSPHPIVEHIISLLPGDPQLKSWNTLDSITLERPGVNLQQLHIYGSREWSNRIRESLTWHFPKVPDRQRSPLATIGPIISSNHLLKDPSMLIDLLKTHRSVLAVEMEAAGAYEAARRPDRIYPVMAIRGISDIVGLQRDNRWTAYACQTAAAFAYALIMTAPIDPRPEAETFSINTPHSDLPTTDQLAQSLLVEDFATKEPKVTQPLPALSKIEDAINNARPGWTLCFIGEDQSKKLATLTQDLRGKVSHTGDGKQITSGFSYWGIGPAIAWAHACNDPFYPLMKESIESFPELWAKILPSLDHQNYHYVSLGVGTGHKDRDILQDLYRMNPDLYYFPVDMSPEMLRIGVQEATKGSPLERRKVLPIQLDFSSKRNIEDCRKLLDPIVDNDPILFSLLGNTLANFEHDTMLLQILSTLIRPQDRLLLEVASTNNLSEEAVHEAEEEYARSRYYCEFVTSALLQNTDMRVNIEDVSFMGAPEQDRAIRIKVLYHNRTNSLVKITLPDRTTVDFPAEDTIRLHLTRKYTNKGIEALVARSGLSFLTREQAVFDPRQSPFNFGIDLMLLAPQRT
jgi:L-histidine Nalpha-methyltransferase